MSFGDALLRRQRAGQTQRGRADVGADGARFDTERKATQARAIDLAVQEIQRQIADRKEAIRAFNEALAPSEAQLAEKGVAEKACEAMGKRWNPETQHCEPAPEPPKEIPGSSSPDGRRSWPAGGTRCGASNPFRSSWARTSIGCSRTTRGRSANGKSASLPT